MESFRSEGSETSEGLETCSARKLLLLLEHLELSGRLEIHCGGSEGVVEVRDGQPVDVQYAGITGATAVIAIGSLTEGRFEFFEELR